eukprot:4304438-Amphidinium_carterae.1
MHMLHLQLLPGSRLAELSCRWADSCRQRTRSRPPRTLHVSCDGRALFTHSGAQVLCQEVSAALHNHGTVQRFARLHTSRASHTRTQRRTSAATSVLHNIPCPGLKQKESSQSPLSQLFFGLSGSDG